MSLVYNPNAVFSNFLIIGAGGTGGRVLAQLAQLIPTVPWIQRMSPSMYVWDDDTVEQKNLSRQLFAKSDIGKHKAVVLAQRYSKQYDVPITAITERIKDESTLIMTYKAAVMAEGYSQEEAITRMMRPTLAILAVDTMEARRNVIASLAQMYFPYNIVVLDPGNEDTFGQVSVFNPINHPIHSDMLGYASSHMDWVNAIPDFHIHQFNLNYIPMPLSHYLLAQDAVGTGSCADLDQTLALNSLMASAIVAVAQSLMFCLPVEVRTAWFSLSMDNRADKIGLKWLKNICQGNDPKHLSRALYDGLQVQGIDFQQFVNRIIFDECAWEGLKQYIKAPMSQGQIELMKNLIFLPAMNLELFTAQSLRKLEDDALEAQRLRAEALAAHAAQLAADAAAAMPVATPEPTNPTTAAPAESVAQAIATDSTVPPPQTM